MSARHVVTHATKRAWERYGLIIGAKEIGQIIAQVQNGQATKVRKIGSKLSIYDVWVCDRMVRIVYHRGNKFVITFLPPPPEWSNSPRIDIPVTTD